MTDLEMTKLCAEAMGLSWEAEQKRIAARDGKWLHGYETPLYDPLHDDAQAMALMKKFRLGINAHNAEYQVWPQGGIVSNKVAGESCSFNVELNRAIVECVAKMRTQ